MAGRPQMANSSVAGKAIMDLVECFLELSEEEFVFQCPTCLAIEGLMFIGDKLVPTKRWQQDNGHITHGACAKPCRRWAIR